MSIGMKIATLTKGGTGKMNQFRVHCSQVNYFTVLVDAESAEEARELANNNINDHPVDDEYVSDYTIEDVSEV